MQRPRSPRQDPFAFGAARHVSGERPNESEGRGHGEEEEEEETRVGGQEENRSLERSSSSASSSARSGVSQRQRLFLERDVDDDEDNDDGEGNVFYATKYTGHRNIQTVKQASVFVSSYDTGGTRFFAQGILSLGLELVVP